MQNKYVVLDFETTGLKAGYHRIIEVGAVIVTDGEITDSYAQLMDPGEHIPSFITELTGISNAMVRGQPSPEQVMPTLKAFIGNMPIIAHNASFDSRFFFAEMGKAGLNHCVPFLCTMMLSRRLVHKSPNYRLGTLVDHLQLKKPKNVRAHRALDDVYLTAELWFHLQQIICSASGRKHTDIDFYLKLMKTPKAKVDKFLSDTGKAQSYE
ncbi:MAG: 3'-5' exonuclease [Fibrobacteres bacterium]|nr:3'-5' exonuclease [Fibrobacterota bacterium]